LAQDEDRGIRRKDMAYRSVLKVELTGLLDGLGINDYGKE
jgi:hypothetical protein